MPLDQWLDPIRPASKPDAMSLGEHIEELRKRLLLSLLGVLVTSGVMLFFGRDLVVLLVAPLADVLEAAGQTPQLIATSVTAPFTAYLKVSLAAGLVVASPWVVYQLWLFVSSGLYPHERKVIYTILPFSTLMSGLAVAFLYFILLPISLGFLIFFATRYPPPDISASDQPGWLARITAISIRADTEGDAALSTDAAPADRPSVTAIPIHGDTPAGVQVGDTWIDADSGELHVWAGQRVLRFVPLDDLALIAPRVEIGSYISFVALLALGVVIAFQLPVVLLVLGWSGAVDPAWLAQYRRYALFACFAVGAVFTPADPVSMVVLAVPLYLLFELGLILARLKKPRVPEEL